jgi:hypothetical protein
VGRMITNPPGGSDKSQSSHRRNILHDLRGTEGSHPQINRQSTQPGPSGYGGNSHDIVEGLDGSVQANTSRQSHTVPSAGLERPNVEFDPLALSPEETKRDQAKLINEGLAIQSAYTVSFRRGAVSDVLISPGPTGSNRLLDLITSMDCVRAMDNQRNMESMTTSLLHVLFKRFGISFTTLRVPFRSSEITGDDINWLADESGTNVIVLSFEGGDKDLLYRDARDSSATSKNLTTANIDGTQLRGSVLLYFNGGFMYRLYVDDTEARQDTVLYEPSGAQV